MFEIETKNLKISEKLNRKIDMICRFACVKYEFIPGNIKSIKNTNIAYVKPHILKVKGNDYLILEECEEVFINGYNEKIKLKDLEKKNFVLEDKLRQWKERFDKLVNYLRNKVGKKARLVERLGVKIPKHSDLIKNTTEENNTAEENTASSAE